MKIKEVFVLEEAEDDFAYVVAVLPMRRDPIWIAEQIGERR